MLTADFRITAYPLGLLFKVDIFPLIIVNDFSLLLLRLPLVDDHTTVSLLMLLISISLPVERLVLTITFRQLPELPIELESDESHRHQEKQEQEKYKLDNKHKSIVWKIISVTYEAISVTYEIILVTYETILVVYECFLYQLIQKRSSQTAVSIMQIT